MADATQPNQVTQLTERQVFKLFLNEGHAPDDAAQLTREFSAVRAAKLANGGADPAAPNEGQVVGQLKAAGFNGADLTKKLSDTMPARGGIVELKPTADENASRMQGAVGGATLGFDDEIWGLTKAMMGTVGPRGINDVITGRKSFWDTYRDARDTRRETKKVAEEANPLEYKIAEVIGSLPATVLAGPMDKLRQMVVGGLKLGGAMGAGNSESDLTKGEVGGVAADTGIGAVAGALMAPAVDGAMGLAQDVVGGAGRIVANAARRVAGREVATPVQQAASEMATRVAANADEPSLIGRNETIRSATLKAAPIAQDAAQAIKRPFQLRPSQITGDAEAALSESRAFNVPDTTAGRRTLQNAQASVRKQLQDATDVVDVYHKRIAANPKWIGQGGVGDLFGKAVDKQVDAMIAARSSEAGPLYDQVEKIGGGVDAAPIRAKLEDVLQRMGLQRNQMTGVIGRVLGDVEKTGAGGGLSITEANGLRRMMLETMRGKASPFGNRALNVQGHMAREVIGAIDESFASAAQHAPDGAVPVLLEANKIWSTHTRAIESAVTDAVETITAKAGGETGGTIGARMLRMQPRQIEGLFSLAEKGDPSGAAAADMRSELFFESLRKGSMPDAETAANGQAMIRPRTALDQLIADTPVLSAAFKGQPKARLELARTRDLLERVSFTPNIRGSTTVPWLADMIRGQGDSLAVHGGEAVAGKAGGAIVRTLSGIVNSIRSDPELAVKAVSTPEGVSAFRVSLEAMLKSGGNASQDAARAALEGLKRAGIVGGDNTVIPATARARQKVFGDPAAQPEAPVDVPGPNIASEAYSQ